MDRKEIMKTIGELDLHRLNKKLVEAGFGPIPVVIGDLFAAGCYFISAGKQELGFKLCKTALYAHDLNEDILDRILSHIEGNEKEMASLLNPHSEVPIWLFETTDGDHK